MTKNAELFDALLIVGFVFLLFVELFLIRNDYFLSTSGKALIFLGFVLQFLMIYSSVIEPKKIVEYVRKIPSKKKNIMLNITLISDVGVGSFKYDDFLEEVVCKVNKIEPDLVFILGDLIDGDPQSLKYISPLKNLKPKYGSYFVFGNHDYGLRWNDVTRRLSNKPNLKMAKELQQQLEELGVKVLVDEKTKIKVGKQLVEIVGLDEVWLKTNGYKSLRLGKNNNYKFLLCHNPDIIQHRKFVEKFDLILAGHTHGGQIRLPILGPILPQPISLNQRTYSRGLISISNNSKLYVSPGLGESSLRMRFLNPPTIDVIEIS